MDNLWLWIGIGLAGILIVGAISPGVQSKSNWKLPIKDEMWKNLQDWQRFRLTVYDHDSVLELAGFYATRSVMKTAWGEDWARSKSTLTEGLAVINTQWPNRTALLVFARPWGEGSYYFLPSQFAFTQDNTQYRLNPSTDIIPMSGDFSTGQLRVGTVTNAFIAIPEGVNIHKTFKLWYGEDSVELEGLK